MCTSSGASANAGPHYQKLYARVTHIWGNRKGQPDRSAMKGPRLERTASLITVPPASGKFFFFFFCGRQVKAECNANTYQPRRGTTMPSKVTQESNLASPRARLHTWTKHKNGGHRQYKWKDRRDTLPKGETRHGTTQWKENNGQTGLQTWMLFLCFSVLFER